MTSLSEVEDNVTDVVEGSVVVVVVVLRVIIANVLVKRASTDALSCFESILKRKKFDIFSENDITCTCCV